MLHPFRRPFRFAVAWSLVALAVLAVIAVRSRPPHPATPAPTPPRPAAVISKLIEVTRAETAASTALDIASNHCPPLDAVGRWVPWPGPGNWATCPAGPPDAMLTIFSRWVPRGTRAQAAAVAGWHCALGRAVAWHRIVIIVSARSDCPLRPYDAASTDADTRARAAALIATVVARLGPDATVVHAR